MARKFGEYRIVDGRTKFAASDINPRFESIDQRLHAQEVIEKDWRGAVYEITTFGLRRIDELIGPAKEDLDLKIEDAGVALAAAEDMLASLSGDQIPISQIDGLPFSWSTKTTAYTAVAGDRILADTSAGVFTVTLPAAPASGDEVWFADPGANWATNNLTVSGNGKNIDGAATFAADVNEGHFIAAYNGTAWVVRFAGGAA